MIEDNLFSKGFQLGLFGHEIDDEEVIADCKAKAPQAPKTAYQKFSLLFQSVTMLWRAKALTEEAKSYRPEFNVNLNKASSKELFNVVAYKLDQFAPAYSVHMKATMASMFSNSILYSFLFSNMKFDDGKSMICWFN